MGTMWVIWMARRKEIHESIFQTLLITHEFVNWYISKLDDLKKLKVIKPSIHVASGQNTLVWKFPPVGL